MNTNKHDSLDYAHDEMDLVSSEAELQEVEKVGNTETEVLLLEQLEFVLDSLSKDTDAIETLEEAGF